MASAKFCCSSLKIVNSVKFLPLFWLPSKYPHLLPYFFNLQFQLNAKIFAGNGRQTTWNLHLSFASGNFLLQFGSFRRHVAAAVAGSSRSQQQLLPVTHLFSFCYLFASVIFCPAPVALYLHTKILSEDTSKHHPPTSHARQIKALICCVIRQSSIPLTVLLF